MNEQTILIILEIEDLLDAEEAIEKLCDATCVNTSRGTARAIVRLAPLVKILDNEVQIETTMWRTSPRGSSAIHMTKTLPINTKHTPLSCEVAQLIETHANAIAHNLTEATWEEE